MKTYLIEKYFNHNIYSWCLLYLLQRDHNIFCSTNLLLILSRMEKCNLYEIKSVHSSVYFVTLIVTHVITLFGRISLVKYECISEPLSRVINIIIEIFHILMLTTLLNVAYIWNVSIVKLVLNNSLLNDDWANVYKTKALKKIVMENLGKRNQTFWEKW